MLISPFESEPVSASEMTFTCTWVCVLRSCTSAGESGDDGELPCVFSCTLDLGRGPRLALSFAQINSQFLYCCSFCKGILKSYSSIFFFPFGPYSSPTAARADRIGMAVGGWGRWEWREEWQPSVSGQSLNHRTALAYENDMGEFSLCLFGRRHAINPTQARGCLWGIIIREQIFDFSISTNLERLWTCCAQLTFLRLFPRQM